MRELGLSHEWIGAGNREDLTYPVLELRELTQKLGLARKYRGRLLLTGTGRRLMPLPVELWWHIAGRLPLGKPDTSEHIAGLVALLSVAAGGVAQQQPVGPLVAWVLNDLGWRRADELISDRGGSWAASETLGALRHLGAFQKAPGRFRDGPPPPEGQALARAALAAGQGSRVSPTNRDAGLMDRQPAGLTKRDRRLRRSWDKQAASYDRSMSFADRYLFADTRAWVCGQAVADTLEVAIGTGLNLAHYPPEVRVTGIEWSADMLARAERRAADLGRAATLQVGDARALPYPDASFDTVVGTFVLCAVPDDREVLVEMARVLRPGGRLLLADHICSSRWPIRVLQAVVETVSVPLSGEHFRRRPALWLAELGLRIERQERFRLGLIERIAATTPVADPV
jgi:ubiquinone/menaquinone biosynthesis C-methylase UbiE